jgi:CRP-like cAMP-binding protein
MENDLQLDENEIGDEIATREEGEFLGEMSLITGDVRTATVLAHTNCVMINVSAAALLPLMASSPELKDELTDIMQTRLSGKPFTSGVKLRLHQALACGPMWMAHVGGASLDTRQVSFACILGFLHIQALL